METSMEKDVRAYGQLPTKEPEGRLAPLSESDAAERVGKYRAALAHAATNGTLSDEKGTQIAGEAGLGLASASPSAAALVLFERALHVERRAALSWSNDKTDQSTKVLALDSLAADAAGRLQVDLMCLEAAP